MAITTRAQRALGRLARRLRGARSAPAPLPKGWLGPLEDELVPPRSVWIGPGDPIGHYYRWVWEYLAYLMLLCGLQRTSQVLELGCGHGRTARGLLEYLRSPGRYLGLDVDRARIEDAQQRIQARYPNFQFQWADVHSGQYNPGSTVRAEAYAFPAAAGTFDVVYAASLFTHLLPAEACHYLRETRNVLKTGGRCLFSFFLLDHYRGPGTTVSPLYEFPHALADGVAVRDPAHPDDLVGYSVAWIRAAAAEAGLAVEKVLPGLWSESPGHAVNEQDLVVLVGE